MMNGCDSMMNHTNYVAECEVISKIMQDNSLIFKVNAVLQPDDFSDSKLKPIYEQAIAYAKEGKEISAVSLYEPFKSTSITLSTLMEIQSAAATTKDIQTYISIVKENSRKRKLRKLLHESGEALDKSSSEEVSQNIMTGLYKSIESNMDSNMLDDSEAMGNAIDFIDKLIKSDGESVGMKSGWRGLDLTLKGLHKGDLIILGARPSMGKTMFALNLAERLAEKNRIVVFELEMSHEKLNLRRLAAKSRIPLNKIYQAQSLNSYELSLVMKNANFLHERNSIVTDTTPSISIEHIRNRLHYLKTTKGVDVCLVDHIGLMKMSSKAASRNEGIGEITAGLKAIAKEFEVCIIALSQLNRSVESRADKRPMLSDLRDSGTIEQDADVVMFLYRDGYYNADKDNVPEVENLEVIIAKNRDGQTRTINMAANLQMQVISEIYK